EVQSPSSDQTSPTAVREDDGGVVGRLVSIGYEHRALDGLIDELRRHGVTTVFDVRLTPTSRKPGMSKKRISEAAAVAGIDYVHAKALGNPKDNRDGYHRGDADAIERYRAVLARPEGT